MLGIVPIVEGKGEVEAVPVLLRRILIDMDIFNIKILRPFRVPRHQIVREGQMERAARQAVRSRGREVAALLVILDCDDDCPARLGPELHKRCRDAVPNIPVGVVLARREFESWFLGAKESLRGKRGIRNDAPNPENPEEIRGAKEHLERNMKQGVSYLPVDDQPALAAEMDLNMARRRCPSFDKLVREVQSLVSRMRKD